MSRQGQLAAEPRRPPSGPAQIDQRGDQLSRPGPRRPPPERPAPARRLPQRHRHYACRCLVVLSNTYGILIILDRARRARRKPTVLCEVMGRLDRTCHNFVTVFRCGRVARGICPLDLDFLGFSRPS